jgi:hypothetical protein
VAHNVAVVDQTLGVLGPMLAQATVDFAKFVRNGITLTLTFTNPVLAMAIQAADNLVHENYVGLLIDVGSILAFGALGKLGQALGVSSWSVGARVATKFTAGTVLGGAIDLAHQYNAIARGEQQNINKNEVILARVMSGVFTAAFMQTCFTAGTPLLLTETTSKPIEEFRSYEDYGDDCDWILTREENNPDAPLVRKRVLRKFVRVAPVLTVRVQGQTIETTAEHPFWVADRPEGDCNGSDYRGWLPAGLLRMGDVLISHTGRVVVEDVADSGLQP